LANALIAQFNAYIEMHPPRLDAWQTRHCAMSSRQSDSRTFVFIRGSICYLLFAICYSGLRVSAEAGDILRGNIGPSSSAAASSYYGGNQAAMSQLQNNANDILTRAADAMKSVQAMQQAARNAALNAASNVPNGLTTGGLQIATGNNAEWTGANQPTQSTANGQTTVAIQQTSSQAILTWQTFNVGKNTTVDFNQSGGGASANTWVALNRILSGTPSQILGSIKAQGQVYLINQNGIVFGGASQVNVSTLLAGAASISDSQFIDNGIYSPISDETLGAPSFTNGLGAVVVDAGAQLVTNAPLRTGDRGGSVILLGGSVQNNGSIITGDGQTVLAAGSDFYLIQGYSIIPGSSSSSSTTQGNETSTTLGAEVAVKDGGNALNTGLIEATTGDITMVGHQVTQGGVMIATSSVDQRGTIHLLTSTSDASSSITLAAGSLTYIEPDPYSGTALDPQQTAAYAEDIAYFSAKPSLNDQAELPDRVGISRIEITTGGTIDFANGSLTSATAGQIAVDAGKRVFVSAGAELDVSGLVNVPLPMSDNNLAVNIQGFELRDSPDNRDTELLFNNTVYVDLSQLVEVPANSSYNAPYNTENRYYTAGGLLEVSGELNNVGHSIEEWDTIGGAITITSDQVIAQKGSTFDIAGGSIQYQAGYLRESYVIASDGEIYNVNTAPAGLTYVGVFNGFVVNHPRWNITETYQNVVTQPSEIYFPGYIEGRDAGTLTIAAATSIFEGSIDAQTVDGPQQDATRPSEVTDPFLLTENTVTLNGSLILAPAGGISSTPYSSDVVIGDPSSSLATNLTLTSPISASLTNINTLSASQINSAQLGGLTVDVQAALPKASPGATTADDSTAGSSKKKSIQSGPNAKGYLTIEDALIFADGAQISLDAANVVIAGDITAPDGNVSINSVSYAQSTTTPVTSLTPARAISGITLAADAVIDTEGLWTNAFLDPNDITGEAYVDGGNVTLSSNQGITLASGSLIEASSGAAILPNRNTLEGLGGNISIEADQPGNVIAPSTATRTLLTVQQAISKGALVLDGTIVSDGVKAGGALTLQAYSVIIGNGITATARDQLVLSTSFFGQGFSAYNIHGMTSLTVEPGADIDVTEPVYEFSAASYKTPTGATTQTALGDPVLMPVYVGNPYTAAVTQRAGASISLLAGVNGDVVTTTRIAAGGTIDIGTGSVINVDPGQSIDVEAAGQITVDGTLRAPSGFIEIVNYRPLGGVGGSGKNVSYEPDGLSIWIGSSSRLDVSAQAFVALDQFGRPYGVVPNGGSIVIGSTGGVDSIGDLISTDAFVIIRPGATLEASGTSAVLDLFAGATPAESIGGTSGSVIQRDPVYVASDGGSISLSSYDGIYIDGTLNASAGGPGGIGGTLEISLIGPDYQTAPPPFSNSDSLNPLLLVPKNLRAPRSIVIEQQATDSELPISLEPGENSPSLKIGYAVLSADTIAQGGFANLSFYASSSILFKGNVNLTAKESIEFFATSVADTTANGKVVVATPYAFFGPTTGLFQINELDGALTLTNTEGTVPRHGTATLTISADLIDLEYATFGDFEEASTQNAYLGRKIDNPAFADVNFVSQGDIRFIGDASIVSPGSLSFTAAQLYPVSGAEATVEAGVLQPINNQSQPFAPGTSISIYRISQADPAVPQSVFGQLRLEAETINQDGIIRAPLGSIVFGVDPNGTDQPLATKAVNFLPGSITSVSANGLTIPYGGTTDGVTYTVNGQTFTTPDVVDAAFSASRGITLEGYSVSVSSGALLDLSGGGNLFGEGFISGRGGSLNVLATALINQDPSYSFSSAGDTVYAIVPGVQTYAPATVDTDSGYSLSTPGIGQQITIPAGVPGLAAGVYTLMPANYALLPGAYRVELGGRADTNQPAVLSLDDGSYEVGVNKGIYNTGFYNALPTEAIITPASSVETYSQFDLETYAQVAVSQANIFDEPRPSLPVDASTLTLDLQAPVKAASQLTFDGTANFTPGPGGYSGSLEIVGTAPPDTPIQIEITGPNATPTQGWISLPASAIDAIGAPNLYIGGSLRLVQGFLVEFQASVDAIAVRTDALLTAADVSLMTLGSGTGITIESGAVVDTLEKGTPDFTSSTGYFFTNFNESTTTPLSNSVVALSNGYIDIIPTSSPDSGPITVEDGASLFADGSIAFATNSSLNLGENVNYGARYIGFAATNINLGSASAFAAAKASHTLPIGLLLDQTLLDDLLRGDAAVGAPGLEILTLAASDSINIFGSATLNTINPTTGQSTLQLVLDTPAVYGAGQGSDVVTITTNTLVWNGLANVESFTGTSDTSYTSAPAGPVIPHGPGTGSGTLNIVANQIVFGYSSADEPQNIASLSRLVLGFSTVNLTATQQITGNNKGSFSVYLSQTAPGSYTGGNLNLITPVLTGAPGSDLSYKAGGALTLVTPAGELPATSMTDSLGAEIDLTGETITDSTSIIAASGKVTLTANGNIALNAGSLIDVSGLTVSMFDQKVPTFGGDIDLESTTGNIAMASSSIINVSAIGANAGGLTITATDASAGQVSLAGTLLGSSSGDFDGGSFNIRAQNVGDFITLNQLLDTGGFFYSRSFDIEQGSIVIPAGTTITAHNVAISVDNGSLTVSGTINASGATPGTIRLSAFGNLEIASTAILDVHSTVLQVDSYGQPIFAENQGIIDLTVADGSDSSTSTLNNGQGILILQTGATIDMSSPDGVDRGDLELNVPRTGLTSGNVRIEAGNPLNIIGAQTIAVNAFWTYAPTDPDGTIVQSAGSDVPAGAIILDQVNQDSLTFIANAIQPNGQLNATLHSELVGLTSYKAAFHLRPGVEIVSATPTGNLTVQGDIDLSEYRYASVNPYSQLNPKYYGSGEPGVLILRAGGNLYVYGSINDGFAPVNLNGMTYPDENGWVLFAGKQTLGDVVIETSGVTLAAGTSFPNSNVTLSYGIPIGVSTLNQNVYLPASVTLDKPAQVIESFIALAPIEIPGGKTYHTGETVPAGITLPKGTIVSGGSLLPFQITIAAMTWPAGATLGVFASSVKLDESLTLTSGDELPEGVDPRFGSGVTSVDTRPVNSDGIEGQIYAVEPMLSLGPKGEVPLSWSIELVAGADTAAADTETLQAQSALNGSGNLVLDDLHYSLASDTPIFSVIRTGTGSLALLAGGNFEEESLYGIYTAGARTPSITAAGGGSFDLPRGVTSNGFIFGGNYDQTVYEYIADNDYQAYYPTGGGNVLVSAQGNLTGFNINGLDGAYYPAYSVSNWLWTQGGTQIAQNAAWWINFGTYAANDNGRPIVTGFTGIGALGGGNVTVIAGGNAGVTAFSANGETDGGLIVAVGATGRVISVNNSGGGDLVETGGGDVTIEIGEALNPVAAAYGQSFDAGFTGGSFVDLRGNLSVQAGSIGGIDLIYGQSESGDPIPTKLSTAAVYSYAFGGPQLIPGDATIDLAVRGDLVLGNAIDPGIINPLYVVNTTEATDAGKQGDAESFFSLWTSSTAINAFSAGGNIVPFASNSAQAGEAGLFPANLRLWATDGSVYSGVGGVVELAPSPQGQLEILAEDSVYGDALANSTIQILEMSGASTGGLASPFDPAFYLLKPGKPGANLTTLKILNYNVLVVGSLTDSPTLFAFELDSASGTLHTGDSSPALIYAVTGDIVNLQLGQTLTVELGGTTPVAEYIGAKAVDVEAGGNIVAFGESETSPSFILNNSDTDVSIISAGKEILFANVDIAGPGTLEVSAGGNLYQGAQANIVSVGEIGTPKIQNPDGGASIIVFAGVGSQGPNWTGFANLYLNPANLANSTTLLVDQPGKVIETYQGQLLTWLQTNFDYTGSSVDELAYFESLPTTQQSIFLLQVFFDELNQSGLEYNDPTSRFYQSYLRGQEAIAALFPSTGSDGQPISYNGNLTLFSAQGTSGVTNSSILTDFGGGITTIVPGGQTIVGVTGVTPGAQAGILTQGFGDINMYSEGSVLLGESRILTTYGGNILIWSGGGDINAGIGAKGTVIFAPPGIVYDDYSDIILSPTTPSSGAGIGTLDPIPGIPPGDVNLVAPEGTIDAGEAGIRASGNANLAARVIVNAANISVSGKTTGIPTVVSPNVASVTAASNAAGASTNAANQVAQQQANQAGEQPESVIIIEVLGYGGGDSD
jgi:filamentous hemagglutinin family protein